MHVRLVVLSLYFFFKWKNNTSSVQIFFLIYWMMNRPSRQTISRPLLFFLIIESDRKDMV